MKDNVSEQAQLRSAQLLETLIKRREQLGLSQTQVAELLDLPRQAVSRAERRGGGGNLESFIEWADALGLEVVLIPKEG